MTPYPVGVLNERGVEHFRDYLRELARQPHALSPREMLYDPVFSAEWQAGTVIESRNFPSRWEAARFFAHAFAGAEHTAVDYNENLWSWLSLFYFDQVCPPGGDGLRRPGRDYRHIPDRSYRYRHRHLLAGPYHVFHLHGDRARLLLSSPLHVETRFHHELAGRQNFISNPAIVEAASILYFDDARGRPKPRAQTSGRPGTLPRFVDVIQQLDLTYDLYSMTAGQLLSLLPPEFDQWKPVQLPFISPESPEKS